MTTDFHDPAGDDATLALAPPPPMPPQRRPNAGPTYPCKLSTKSLTVKCRRCSSTLSGMVYGCRAV